VNEETVNARVVNALAPTGYKVYTNSYTGGDDVYFVFLLDVVPDFFANDVVQYVINNFTLHLYCPLTMNTVALRKQIKSLLQDAGFTYPNEMDASDEHYQHIVFDFECEEYVDG